MNVIDLSSNQSGLDVAHIDALDAILAKATEGSANVGKYVNPVCDRHYQQAKTRGIGRGFYHFAGSSIARTIDSPQAEWDWFHRNTLGYWGDGVPMLDWEPYGYGLTPTAETNWVDQWTELCHGATGVNPILYLDYNHVHIWDGFSQDVARKIASRCSVLIAGGPWYNNVQGFSEPTPRPVIPDYWHVIGWQYTSRGNLNGYYPIDLDAFYVDINGWNQYVRGDNAGISPTSIPAPSPVAPAPAPIPESVVYRIQPADTLSTIAAKFGTTWQELQRINGIANPNVIYAGQVLVIRGTAPVPTPTSPVYHRVQSGETLSSIAARYGTSWEHLQQINGIKNPNVIYAGQNLRIS